MSEPAKNPHTFPDYLENVLYRLDDYGCTRKWWERYVRDLRAAIARYGNERESSASTAPLENDHG